MLTTHPTDAGAGPTAHDVFGRTTTDPRVIVADGYGVTIKVQRGQLHIVDGIGQHRRERTLSRVERTVRRIIVTADTGYVSWDATRWCADVGIVLAQLDRDARVCTIGGMPEPDDARLRRAQAFATADAPHEHVGVDIARDILTTKLAGQASVAETMLGDSTTAGLIRDRASKLAYASSAAELMPVEAQAAVDYWKGWAGRVIVPFDPRDVAKVPAHWTTFLNRASPINTSGGNARTAADPVNALLNYAYRIAEFECRIACLTVGLDPSMGFLHSQAQNRDSLALDLIETVRPEVDRFVLGLLSVNRAITYIPVKWFTETREGACRLVAPVTHLIAEQALKWARIVAPHAEHVANTVARIGRGEIRPAKPLTHDHVVMSTNPSGPPQQVARPLTLPGPVTVERIIPDDVWHHVEHRVPVPASQGRGRKPIDDRVVLAGIVCAELLGCAYSRIPQTIPVSRYTVAARLTAWRNLGVWDDIRDTLNGMDHIRALRSQLR